jgi:putative two-component system response regulator
MVERGVYADDIHRWIFDTTVSSARLHDIGKIAISDAILNKPGSLTYDEFGTMKSHAAEGEKIIEKIIERTGDIEFFNSAKLFAGYHHEHWDGSGYPRGLKGTEIPLQGRIMTIVDMYDALVSKRPYKESYTHEEAVNIIAEKDGIFFDPEITKVFFEVKDLFRELGLCLSQ